MRLAGVSDGVAAVTAAVVDPLHRPSVPRGAFLVALIALFLLSLAKLLYVVLFSDLQRSQLCKFQPDRKLFTPTRFPL